MVNRSRKIENYWKLASVCITNEDKINYYDLYEEAFLLDVEGESQLSNAKDYFSHEWGIDLEEYEKRHSNYPSEFKIYAFDHCILNGNVYSKIKNDYGFY